LPPPIRPVIYAAGVLPGEPLMSRGRGVLAAVLQAARAAERERVAAERRRLNELVRAERQQARQAQRDHRSGREHEAESLNADLHHQMERLQSLLTDALSTRSKVDVGVLSRRGFEEQPFAPGGLG